MYAIVNTKTGKFVFGTDYRYSPVHQRTSHNQMLTFPDRETAEISLKARRCSSNYKVCEAKVEIKRIIDP